MAFPTHEMRISLKPCSRNRCIREFRDETDRRTRTVFYRTQRVSSSKVPAAARGVPDTPLVDIHLDIVEGGGHAEDAGAQAGPSGVGKPSLQVYFRCSNQYVRVLRASGGQGAAGGYVARCPRCGKSMRFVVGEGGTSRRFFELSC